MLSYASNKLLTDVNELFSTDLAIFHMGQVFTLILFIALTTINFIFSGIFENLDFISEICYKVFLSVMTSVPRLAIPKS